MTNQLKELVEKRTLRSKTYHLGGNTFKLVVSEERLHHPDKNGVLQDVDLTPKETNREFIVKGAGYVATLDRRTMTVSVTDDFGNIFKMGTLDSPNLSVIKREGRALCVEEAFPGVDLVLSFTPRKVEWFKRIKSKEAKHTFSWWTNGDSAKFFFRQDPQGFDADGNRAEIVIKKENRHSFVIWSEEITGRVSKIVDLKTRRKTFQEGAKYPLFIDVPDVSISVATGVDDGRVTTGAYPGLQNNLTINEMGGLYGGLNPWARFLSVGIPQGATITYANVVARQKKEGPGFNPNNWRLKIKDVDNVTSAPSNYADVMSSLATATGAIYSRNAYSFGTVTHSADALLNHIVNRTGWASGNNIQLVATRIAGPVSNYYVGRQGLAAYEHATEAPARLEIVYSSGIVLTAETGSFSVSGSATGLYKGFASQASSGTFVKTGTSTGLVKDSIINVSAGSFTYTGTSAGTLKGFKTLASAGTYSVTGALAGAYKDSIIHVSAGSFTYTGTSAETLKGFKTLASSSSYLYSGVPVNFYRGLKVLTSSGTFVETGASVSLLKYAKIEAEGTEYEYDSAVASGRLKVTTTTDSNGDFSTTLNLSPGTYSIRARQTVDSSIGPWTDYQRFSVTT